MQSKKILFISHDASRTGAPILLLNFLKYYKTHVSAPFEVLLKKGGILEEEFSQLASAENFNLFESEDKIKSNSLLKKLKRKFAKNSQKLYFNKLKTYYSKAGIDIIYSNTMTNGDVLKIFADLNCPIICHVHELEFIIRSNSTWHQSFQETKGLVSKYIAVSQAVKDNLVKNHQIPEEKVEVIYGFNPRDNFQIPKRNEARKYVQNHLGISSDAKLVCASGTMDWRKGTDLFIQLASLISQTYTESCIHFIWVGGESSGERFNKLWFDVQKLGLEDKFHFLGSVTNPLDYFAASDVFAMVSREDPFPVVCLEAASVETPIVCFDKSGGEKEFVEHDCGAVVSYLDLATMADKTIEILRCDTLRNQLGKRAAQKAKERHDVNVIAPKILDVIHSL